MKHLRIFVLATIAMGALMAFAGVGTASATTLTCGTGTHCPVGTSIHADSEEHTVLDTTIGQVQCNSTFKGKTTNTGGTGETVNVNIEILLFNNCTNGAEVTVLAKGSLEIHGLTGNKGTLTSTGTELTVTWDPFHCIFKTNGTDLGTWTGSPTHTSHATIDISATIPRVGGRSGAFCGSSAPWTGSYTVTEPLPLFIDA